MEIEGGWEEWLTLEYTAGIKGSFGYCCRFELLASWSCFVERTTVNKLVNSKFTASACGLVKFGDREDDENDCCCYFLCACVQECVCEEDEEWGAVGE